MNNNANSEEMKARLWLFPWFLWGIWKARNELCFSNVVIPVETIIENAIRDKEEWFAHQPEPQHLIPTCMTTRDTWRPHAQGNFKCNVDAAWNRELATCGVGWILRDSNGHARWYGAKAYPLLQSSMDAEAAWLLWAM